MTQEDKAKAYDEALKVLHKYDGANIMFTQDLKEEMFPELKESEDERIRKEIIDFATKVKNGLTSILVNNYDFNKWIAWLEKQGEQKPAEWTMDNVEELTEFENAMMHIGGSFFGEHQGLDPNNTNVIKEQANALLEFVPRQEWSEEDDIMVHDIDYALRCQITYPISKLQSMSNWIFNLKDRVQPQIKQEWNEEDEEIIEALISLCDEAKDNIPQLSALKNWLNSLKDRVQPQPKQSEQNLVLRDTFGYEDGRLFGMNEGIGLVLDNPEKYGLQKPVKWSKEDESVISLILTICNDFLESFEISPASTKVVKEDIDKIKNWLKALKPQNTWKPSDEQMKALNEAIYHVDDSIATQIAMLIGDLKKLREE